MNILVFEESLSVEIALEWLVKDTIMWLILVFLAIFSKDPVYPGSLVKDLS